MGSNHVEFMSGWKIYKLIPGVSNQREQPGTVIGLKTGTGKCVGVESGRGLAAVQNAIARHDDS